MANRNFRNDTKAMDQGLVISAGTITLAPQAATGTLADTITFASASMRSAGVYRIAYEDTFVSLKSGQCSLEHTGSQNLRVEISGSVFSSAGKYVDLHILSGSALTKPSTEGTKIHWSAFLKNSGQ